MANIAINMKLRRRPFFLPAEFVRKTSSGEQPRFAVAKHRLSEEIRRQSPSESLQRQLQHNLGEHFARRSGNSPRRICTILYQPPLPSAVIAGLFEKLFALRSLPEQWEMATGAKRPNRTAFANACHAMIRLLSRGLSPDRVVPSAEGGIALVFLSAGRYADVECFNTGEVCAVISGDNVAPKAWDVDLSDLRETVRIIREHARSGSPNKDVRCRPTTGLDFSLFRSAVPSMYCRRG
jgi:hypothetical protein